MTAETSRNGLLIIGAGGHGRVIADLAEEAGWTGIAFADDRPEADIAGLDWPLAGSSGDLPRLLARYPHAALGIGNNGRRAAMAAQVLALGFSLPVLIHPSASVSRRARLGAGTIVMANVAVNTGAMTGQAAILNTGCTIDHDCILGEAVHVSPGANLAGTVTVGDETWIGVGAAIRNNVMIGARCMIAAGAAVVSDVAPGITVAGVPARPMKR